MKKTKGLEQTKQATTVQELIGAGRRADREAGELVIEPQRATISQELLEQFERFYEYHPAARLSRNLRSLLLEFLMYDGSAEAEYLRDLVVDLDGLFTLLDAMQEEAGSPVISG